MRVRLIVCAAVVGALQCPALGQSLYLAQAATPAERLDRLLGMDRAPHRSLGATARASADNNLVTLTQSAHKAGPSEDRAPSRPFFAEQTSSGAGGTRGPWRLSVEDGRADLYEGNRDAGRLYLAALRNSALSGFHGSPAATMNRTGFQRVRVEYAQEIPLLGGALGSVVLSCVALNRVQLGTIQTASAGAGLVGTVDLLTTNGVPGSRVRGHGVSLDLAMSTALGDRWRLGISVENAWSRAWVGGMQRITADVNVDQVAVDPDGFLHGLPLVSGRVMPDSLASSFRRYPWGAVAYRQGAGYWVAMASRDVDWRPAIGWQGQAARRLSACVLWWPTAPECHVGVSYGGLSVGLSASSLDPGRAHRGTFDVSYSVGL